MGIVSCETIFRQGVFQKSRDLIFYYYNQKQGFFVEVKTRTSAVEAATQVFQNEPISVFLTIRKNGPLESIEDFASSFGRLVGHIEHIAENRVIPDVVIPLHQAIGI